MRGFTRRRFLTATAAATAASAIDRLMTPAAQPAGLKYTPEKGAKLRMLRWKRFVQGDEDQLAANTRRFTEKTGVEVQVDSENWEEVRPKAAVAANVGAGPDIIIGTDEDPHQYPHQLVDVSDLATIWARSTAGGSTSARNTVRTRADGSRSPPAWPAPPWCIARACCGRQASRHFRRI